MNTIIDIDQTLIVTEFMKPKMPQTVHRPFFLRTTCILMLSNIYLFSYVSISSMYLVTNFLFLTVFVLTLTLTFQFEEQVDKANGKKYQFSAFLSEEADDSKLVPENITHRQSWAFLAFFCFLIIYVSNNTV